jgi:hypothetical protein
MESVKRYLQERLKLKINEQKSAVDRPWKLKFLGFSMHKAKNGQILIRLAPQTIERVKTKIRQITARNKPVSIAERIERLNTYLGGVDGILCPGRNAQHFQEPGRLDAEEAAHVPLEAVEASTDKVPRAACTGTA